MEGRRAERQNLSGSGWLKVGLLPLAIFGFVLPASATMPELTRTPRPLTFEACRAWAKKQSPDAVYMWGVQDDGKSMHDLGISRLITECLGGGTPDIVLSQSSAGMHDEFCKSHMKLGICSSNDEVINLSYLGAWTAENESCRKDISKDNFLEWEMVFDRHFHYQVLGKCQIIKSNSSGISSWEIDEICSEDDGASNPKKWHWSLSVAGDSMIAAQTKPGEKSKYPFKLKRCVIANAGRP